MTAWQALHVMTVNEVVVPTAGGNYYYEATSVGASPYKTAATEPTWGTTVGGTTSDGNITWTCRRVNKRQRIISAWETRLKGITPANHYVNNFSASVFGWRETPLTEAECPGIVYRDRPNVTALSIGQHIHTLIMETDVLIAGDDEDMRIAVADIVKAVGTDVTFGALAEDTIPSNDTEEIEMEHDKKKIWGLRLRFFVTYTTDNWDPNSA